jgi:hypothetical protein
MGSPQTFGIDIPEDAWAETGMDGDPSARLHIGPLQLMIAGLPMHLDAFAVDAEGNAADATFQEEIEAILALRQGDRPDHAIIRGRNYVTVAYPIG